MTEVHKILTEAQWRKFQDDGCFAGTPLDLKDGFIHLSSSDQVEGTLSKYFSNNENLVITGFGAADLGSSLKWEKSRDDQLFPHFYGTLPLSAVKSVMLRPPA
jgi:uncharacterized protein (DUF952 family)